MNTLIVGQNKDSQKILEEALKRRRHSFKTVPPKETTMELLRDDFYSMVILSDCAPETLEFARKLHAETFGNRIAVIAILDQDHIERFQDVLSAGVDQCIIESLYDEQRLDIRLSFAEKLARNTVDRNIIEQKLRESESRYRGILETTVDAIISISNRGEIRTFNKAAERLFQYKVSEVVGKNVKILMPEPYKREHDDYINNYLETGHRKIIGIGREVTGRRKDGSTFPMYLAVSEVKLRDQRIFTGIVRDITEQRRLEQEILRISEHERRRIGQDLHDGLGQMLTGIGLIGKNLTSQLEKEGHKLSEQAGEITSLIRDADQYARELARGLVPVEFDSEGLSAALERLTTHAKKLFGITCSLTSTGTIRFEDATNITHLYRIAQEAVSNAVKHGNATNVAIQLAGNEHHIRLRVEDNGTGFPEDWDAKGGLGVRIMQFRASLIGANLEVSDAHGGGALITCTLPLIGETEETNGTES
ncbi:MAG: PAS domain S-box protein [Balneolaceae bacterium]